MQTSVNDLLETPVDFRERVLVQLKDAYEYLGTQAGKKKALLDYCETTAPTVLDLINGKTRKLNMILAMKIFEFEDICRNEQNALMLSEIEKRENRKAANRMAYQQSRADNETYIENSIEFHEDAQILQAL